MTTKPKLITWKFEIRSRGTEVRAPLVALWEASMDPMSDDYTPGDISAVDLFSDWSKVVYKDHPDGQHRRSL